MKKVNQVRFNKLLFFILFSFFIFIFANWYESIIGGINDKSSNGKTHSFIIPKELLGGQDVEEIVNQFNDMESTFLWNPASEFQLLKSI